MSTAKPRVDVLQGGLVEEPPAYGGFALHDTPPHRRRPDPRPPAVPEAGGEAPAETARPEETQPGESAPTFDATAIRSALAIRIVRDKWNIEAPRPLMRRVARLSQVGGELLDRKRVNEYHILLGALLSLPDPDDAAAVRAFLATIAEAVHDYAE